MSFSFRSLFQSPSDDGQKGAAAVSGNLQSAFSTPPEIPSNAMSVSAPPLNAASPFGAPLFKFAPGEALTAQPLQQSPFSASASPGTGSPLTVADFLPLLPPDISRPTALPKDQPVAISPQALNEALRGGQAALPIFEIYRVCPALFQTPISPQDPRMIPLPASKLPHLIAATSQANPQSPANGAASPFSIPASPFGAATPNAADLSGADSQPPLPASASGMMLPPRRQGPPPPLADVPNREAAAPQLSLPGQQSPGAPAFPMSPFAAVGAQINSEKSEASPPPLPAFAFGQAAPAAAPASPFGQAAPAAAPASPFGQASPAAAPASPFGQAAPAAAPASPFGQAAPAAAPASPFGQASPAAAPASPFGQASPAAAPASPFGQASPASPFGQAAPATAPASPFGQAAPAAAPASPFGQGAPAAAPASPFGQAAPAAAPASPFGQAAPAAAPASPFGQAAPAAAPASPFGQAAPASTNAESALGSLFGSKAIPTGQLAPDTAPARPAQPPAMQMSSTPSASAPLVRICLANILKGYTSAELGFDPMVVPAWIATALPPSKVQEIESMPVPIAELGLFIDGITDVGFRNVLNNAKRDFQLRVPVEELHSALSGASAPQTLPNLASLGSAPAGQPASAPAKNVMRIDPPASAAPVQQVNTAFTPAASHETNSIPGLNSPFLAPSAAAEAAPQPSFTAAVSPSINVPPSAPTGPLSGFGMPATALQPLAPKTQDPFAQSPQATFQPQQPAPQPQTFQPQATFQPQQPAPQPQTFQPQATFQQQPSTPEPQAMPPQPAFQHQPSAEQPSFRFQPPQAEETFSSSPSAFFAAPEPKQPSAPEPISFSPITETTVLPPVRQQESASQHSGFPFMKSSHAMEEGFSSDQLLGRQPSLEQSWSAAAVAAATGPLDAIPAQEQRTRRAPVIDVPQETAQEQTVKPVFRAPRHDASEFTAAPPARPEARPEARPPAAKATPSARTNASNSNLGVQMYDTDPDQILLRALLDTDSELTPQKVVEMACGLPGIAACVCIQGSQSISHIGAHKPQAREFQKQATDLAQHLRTLAPLIGIEGAETFTMNSGDRLMTFCFPEGSILGVLHDAEPTLGLRDKITLIARELSRMML